MSDNAAKVIELIIKGAVPIIFAMVCTLGGILWNHDGRLTAIESNRYTSRDADADRKALMSELKDLRAEMRADIERQASLIRIEIQQLRHDWKTVDK